MFLHEAEVNSTILEREDSSEEQSRLSSMEIYPETDNTESIDRTVAVAAVKTSRVHLTAPYTDRQPRTTASREVFSVRKIGGCLICIMHMTFGPMGMF